MEKESRGKKKAGKKDKGKEKRKTVKIIGEIM